MLKWIKKEFIHVFPAFIFFLASFNLINWTEGLLLRREGNLRFSFLTIFLAAALVAKILIVIDRLPFLEIFKQKPLIFTVIWKTIIYSVSVMLVRLAIRLFPVLWNHQPFVNSIKSMDWTLFWAVQSWYYTLFFVFVLSKEFILVIGPYQTRKIFFGR